jgi:hypothetical protein
MLWIKGFAVPPFQGMAIPPPRDGFLMESIMPTLTPRQRVAVSTFNTYTGLKIATPNQIDVSQIKGAEARATILRLLGNSWDGRSEFKPIVAG